MGINENKFSVTVIATMSSGKSTLLNAMLGINLLPSKNEACTAKVYKVEDVDGMKDILGRSKSSNGNWSKWDNIQKDTLSNWNNADIAEIELRGDFPHIDNYYQKNLKIQFYDTPGPNNSSDITHSEITNNIISDSDYGFIICVMNASQFGVDGERKLLENILHNIRRRNQETKIVFAINKIDELDLERESITSLIKNINAYLSKEIGFKSPMIIPTNSLLSLNIRKIISAHRNKIPLEFSKRKQRQIYREIEYLSHFREEYFKAIFCYCNKTKIKFLNRGEEQDRKIDKDEMITLGDTNISVGKLIDADITTGVPLLEEMLEIELLKSIKLRKNTKKKTAIRKRK